MLGRLRQEEPWSSLVSKSSLIGAFKASSQRTYMTSLKRTPELSSVLHCILIHTHINMCAHIHTFKKKVYRYLYMIYNICIKYTYLWYTIYMVYLYTSICIKHTIFSSQLHHHPAAPWPGSANIYSPPSECYCSHPPPEMVHLNFKG